MFSENLKTLRKGKRLSQEELAIRLNVVRQTISKWEKGLSVPDADLLLRLAEVFEVSVSQLLGAQFEPEADENELSVIAEQLSRISEQLAVRNRRWRTVGKWVLIVLCAFVAFFLLLAIMGVALFSIRTVVGYTDVVVTPHTAMFANNAGAWYSG